MQPIELNDPLIIGLTLEGTLDPDKATIEGVLTIHATNPNDTPSSIPLALGSLKLKSTPINTQQAFLKTTKEGLELTLPGNWTGTLKAEYVLPCYVSGNSGSLRVVFPEQSIGFWKVEFPYEELRPWTRGYSNFIQEKKEGRTIVTGEAHPGVIEIIWTAGRKKAETRDETNTRWRGEANTTIKWENLSRAGCLVNLKLEATDPQGMLPEVVRFTKDSNLHIFYFSGDQTRGLTVDGNDVEINISDTRTASIYLGAILTLPGNTGSIRETQTWNIAGLKPVQDIEFHQSVTFEISDQIEFLGIDTGNLTRVPTKTATQGFTIQRYEGTSREWETSLSLRRLAPIFNVEIIEVFAPLDGFMKRAVSVTVTPRESVLNECILKVPPELRVESLNGTAVARWLQNKDILFVGFQDRQAKAVTFQIVASSDMDTEKEDIIFSPIDILNATDVTRSVVILVSPDMELSEKNVGDAIPRTPNQRDRDLARLFSQGVDLSRHAFQGYDLPSYKNLHFSLSPVEATSIITTYNRATISDGLESITGIVEAEPRKGRIKEITSFFLLPQPGIDVPSRLQVFGPVRDVRVTKENEKLFRISAELTAPHSSRVSIRYQINQPVNTENGDSVPISLFLPPEGSGARALLLVRRAFEGELTVADSSGMRVIDPKELRHREFGYVVLPSDQSFEITGGKTTFPTFSVTRHKREQGLRAVIEILRQRTIISPDGLERHELEIALQNESEQFLKIALPYPKSQVEVYEVQVASRRVKTTFGKEEGRDVLLIPLIRTGLLDPELTVRVAYVVKGRESLKGIDIRRQALPDILGNIPISQSALVLMLPTQYKYSDFKGTLNQVELVDIEVYDAMRRAKRVEKISELALQTTGETQQRALSKLNELQVDLKRDIQAVEQTERAYKRAAGRQILARRQEDEKREAKLVRERSSNISVANTAAMNVFRNVEQLDQLVQQQMPARPQQQIVEIKPTPTPVPPEPPVQFPRVGDVLVFRQLQDTGYITFKVTPREATGKRNDILLLAAIVIFVGILAWKSRVLFSSRRNVAWLLMIISLVAIINKAILDITIPLLIISLILLGPVKKRKRNTQ
jgi:hypothetical protein